PNLRERSQPMFCRSTWDQRFGADFARFNGAIRNQPVGQGAADRINPAKLIDRERAGGAGIGNRGNRHSFPPGARNACAPNDFAWSSISAEMTEPAAVLPHRDMRWTNRAER